jgi:hypothetical protein
LIDEISVQVEYAEDILSVEGTLLDRLPDEGLFDHHVVDAREFEGLEQLDLFLPEVQREFLGEGVAVGVVDPAVVLSNG